jgi:hypothetical protein
LDSLLFLTLLRIRIADLVGSASGFFEVVSPEPDPRLKKLTYKYPMLTYQFINKSYKAFFAQFRATKSLHIVGSGQDNVFFQGSDLDTVFSKVGSATESGLKSSGSATLFLNYVIRNDFKKSLY